jgi:hypothetical protein
MTSRSMASFRFAARVCGILTLAATVSPRARAQDQYDALKRLVVMIRGKLGDAPVGGAGIVFGAGNNRLYIATANHVVRRGTRTAESVEVQLRWLPGEWVPASVLEHGDVDLDLAVIAVPGASKLSTPEFAWQVLVSPQSLAPGNKVFPIGYPEATPWFMNIQAHLVSSVTNALIFTEGNLRPGHSGGALVTEQAGIVGLVTQVDPLVGQSTRIDRIRERLIEWSYSVQLTWKPEALPTPRTTREPGPIPAQQTAPPKTNLKVGDEAPDFTLPETGGKQIRLSDFRGKNVVVLAFFPAAFTGG